MEWKSIWSRIVAWTRAIGSRRSDETVKQFDAVSGQASAMADAHVTAGVAEREATWAKEDNDEIALLVV